MVVGNFENINLFNFSCNTSYTITLLLNLFIATCKKKLLLNDFNFHTVETKLLLCGV
jgi:hypothetical protein